MIKFKQWFTGFGLLAALSAGATAHAAMMPIFTAGFDDLALGAIPPGWTVINRSLVANNNWGGGNASLFPAQAGAAGSYVADSFTAGGGGIVSDWLLTPVLTIGNGYTFSFYTRGDVDTTRFPDSLQVRLSTSGASTDVGTTPAGVGVFTTLLLSVNAALAPGGYPTAWTMYTATVSGVTGPTTGRFALRYLLTDNATQGSYIGIDSVVVSAVPEPQPLVMLALGLTAMGVIARRRTRVVR